MIDIITDLFTYYGYFGAVYYVFPTFGAFVGLCLFSVTDMGYNGEPLTFVEELGVGLLSIGVGIIFGLVAIFVLPLIILMLPIMSVVSIIIWRKNKVYR